MILDTAKHMENSQHPISDAAAVAASDRCLRTWIMIAGMNMVCIYEENSGRLELVESIVPTETEERSIFCVAEYGAKTLLHYNPGIYAQKKRHESLSFAHKISARLDEAMWNDRFDRLVFVAAPPIMADFYRALSQPVQARAIAFIHEDIDQLDTCSLQRTLLDIIGNSLHEC